MQSGEISNKRLLYPQAERVSSVSETAKMPLTYVNKEKQACLFTSPPLCWDTELQESKYIISHTPLWSNTHSDTWQMRDSSFQRAAETNRWWTEWHEDEWRKRSYTVPLYLPNAAVLKQRQAQWGHEQRPRKTRTLGLDNSIVIKEVKQDNALREENSEILRPCRKLRRNLAIIRSMFPCWIQ